MNGGEEVGGGGGEDMEEDGKEEMMVVEARGRDKTVLMWGYLPGVSPQRSPLLHPVAVRMPDSPAGDRWKDVSGGGCGFAMAISESGNLFTWGSTDDMGQSYVTSGKHEETPEVFDLPTKVPIVKAAAGWAHCVAVTVMPKSQGSRTTGTMSGFDSRGGDENTKRRRLSSAKLGPESSSSGEEALSAPPCLVNLNVRCGVGATEEGQLGLGTRIRNVSSPHPVPCIESASFTKDQSSPATKGKQGSDGQAFKLIGTCIKAIACGGRHSAAVTDTGALLTFGWGLYGQIFRDMKGFDGLEYGFLATRCGQGSTDDELSPTCVSSLLGVEIQGVAAGLWHTVCTSVDGGVYSFGGNQFGQLGTGSDQAETLPKQLDAPCLENKNAKLISCGARHSAMLTGYTVLLPTPHSLLPLSIELGLGDSIDRNIPAVVPIENLQPKNIQVKVKKEKKPNVSRIPERKYLATSIAL
ncbi:E3 ubiquitin-protein ligase [Musa troglodytarum]|uniref:E3 ubiquitin-protein ligase n=1 Tax=Musa troglodytarum TaxID=320322 RepID=A0A9E7EK12_9LILI|nr:E3 ubiquitin-protein ligase [Musa troglodytarum]